MNRPSGPRVVAVAVTGLYLSLSVGPTLYNLIVFPRPAPETVGTLLGTAFGALVVSAIIYYVTKKIAAGVATRTMSADEA